jgi:Cd2+/Zn2+-exporting ATPase
MINLVNKHKNIITLLSGLLISSAFIFAYFELKDISDILLIIATILASIPILIKAIQSTVMKQFSIELLVIIAVIGALYIKEYTESSVVTFLFMFGAYLEAKTLKKMRNALKKLTNLSPKTADVIKDGHVVTTLVDDVLVDDLIVGKTGSIIPVDGIVSKGFASVNESSITGESMPVGKKIDEMVYSGTLIEDGYIEIKALKVGRDTTFSKMIELIEEAQESKSKTQKFLDKFAQIYTPVVVLLSIIVLLWTRDLHLSITFLVVACPGALVIGAPVSTVAGISNGASSGILIKGGEAMQNFAHIDALVVDKTGTLTVGRPVVVHTKDYGLNENDWLYYAASAESVSEQHLGKAIVKYAAQKNILLSKVLHDVEIIKGGGIKVFVDDKLIVIGTHELLVKQNVLIEPNVIKDLETEEEKGYTTVLVSMDSKVVGLIAIADEIKKEAKNALNGLKALGIKKVVMLTGDQERVALNVGRSVDVDEIHAGLKPEDKVEHIKSLIKDGYKVAMIGDGLNDAPALATANLGIAMGIAGVEVSTEVADVVLMSDNLLQLIHAYKLAKKTNANMKQNTLIAVLTVVILLSGVLFKLVNLGSGMLIHELSVLVVILNAMRLLKFKS